METVEKGFTVSVYVAKRDDMHFSDGDKPIHLCIYPLCVWTGYTDQQCVIEADLLALYFAHSVTGVRDVL